MARNRLVGRQGYSASTASLPPARSFSVVFIMLFFNHIINFIVIFTVGMGGCLASYNR